MIGLDGEELAHTDFKAEKFVVTLPKFANPATFDSESQYQFSKTNYETCKRNLQIITESYKTPAVAEGELDSTGFSSASFNHHSYNIPHILEQTWDAFLQMLAQSFLNDGSMMQHAHNAPLTTVSRKQQFYHIPGNNFWFLLGTGTLHECSFCSEGVLGMFFKCS